MDTVYLFKDGSLRRKDNTLVLDPKEGKKQFIPVETLNDIKIFSEVTLNKRLMAFLAQKQIPIYFFNHYGHYIGSFYPYEHNSNGCSLLKQTEHYLNQEKRLRIAKSIIRGAVKNMMRLLQYYLRKKKTVRSQIEQIKKTIPKIENAESINSLMAVEATIRKTYYQAIDQIVKFPDFKLIKREKRPPKNYMNTLISYGNTLLYTNTLTELFKTSLDPRIGYLHATNFRRFSLNLDISEIFKPVLIDRTIISMVNQNRIKPKDFKGVQGGINLNDAGKKKFIQEYELRLTQTIKHPRLKRKISYRSLIRHEGYKLIKHLLGEKEYLPFEMEW